MSQGAATRTTHRRSAPRPMQAVDPSRPSAADGKARVLHLVQFYQEDAFLLDAVVRFLADPAAPGGAAIAIAHPQHMGPLRERLQSMGLPALVLDAQEVLSQFMVDGHPDAARFRKAIGDAFAEARQLGNGGVRAFGEMVAILAGHGQTDAAIELEELWNAFQAEHGMPLLCAYPVRQFAGQGTHARDFQRVLHLHSEVLPASEGQGSAEDQRRMVAELERKALTLELETRARQAAEERLQGSEAQVRDFLENGAEPMHQVGGDGRILWANRAELDLLGYSPDEYVGRNIAEFHADQATIKDMLTRLARGETLRDYPARLLCKDGTPRHVLVHSNARIEDGRVVATRCFTRDVTDRIRLDEARKASARLLEVMSDGFLHIDSRWRVAYANPSARNGRTRLDFEGRLLWDLFPEVKGTTFEDNYRRAMERRERVTFEAYYAPMGAWMENIVLPVEDGIWLYYRDVSERHRVQEQLHARNRQQAAVARIGQEALAGKSLAKLLDFAATQVTDTLGVEFCKVLELSPGGELLLRAGVGWKEGVVGTRLVPADSHSQAGYTLQCEGPVIVPDLASERRFGSPALLQEHGVRSGVSVIIQGRDRPYGVLGAHAKTPRPFSEDDVHFLEAVAHLLAAAIERRRIEEELRRHRDHLEEIVEERTRRLAESNQELEAFNYSVSHDLRTPLRAIAGFSGLLATRHAKDLKAPAQRLLGQVQAEAVRMGTLIEELLALSRYHRMELVRAGTDLSALSQSVLEALQASSPGRRVRWRIEPGIRAHVDPHLMRVVLENLLGNAWKFTNRTPDALIEVQSVGDSQGITLCVRDNGAGFDMAYAQKLFQPFQRLHSPSEFEGTGIGLATVARIVGRHGGKAWAEGRINGGAGFYVSLPA